jgi:hypothetical protein
MRINRHAAMVFWGIQAPLACLTLIMGILALKGRGSTFVNAWLTSTPMVVGCFSFTVSTLILVFLFEWMKKPPSNHEIMYDAIVCTVLFLAALPAAAFLATIWYSWVVIRHVLGIERCLSQQPRRR